MNIAQAHRLSVYEIFALARTVIPARDGYLVIVLSRNKSALLLRIVKCDGNLGEAHRTALLRAGKYNILHLCAADVFRRHLAENPAHRIGYIGFSASVRTDYNGQPLVEINRRLVRKRLEAL